MRLARVIVAAAFALLLVGAGAVLTPRTAEAQDIYRYWAYFTVQDGAFVAAATGPAEAVPADGAVEGYRYAAPADFTKPNRPRADLQKVTFDAVCGGTKAAAGQKRVAVLIDYGVKQDAEPGRTPPQPQALCAAVPAQANGLQVLQAVEPKTRTESGSFGPLLCGIADYPTTGCASEVAPSGTPADGDPVDFATASDDTAASAKATGTDSGDGSNVPLLVGAAVVVVLVAAGGTYLARRRSS
ncbi:SCO2322 family protein [Cumulibacter manganitolerans]|uniref:SCO2322 family protein n=1 Tax=Cumulibacter manganitolerans TaxID=1884992 RepID=UPI001295569B|nr:SCO2322 family protein [Cumulibacter manganitolerans]